MPIKLLRQSLTVVIHLSLQKMVEIIVVFFYNNIRNTTRWEGFLHDTGTEGQGEH